MLCRSHSVIKTITREHGGRPEARKLQSPSTQPPWAPREVSRELAVQDYRETPANFLCSFHFMVRVLVWVQARKTALQPWGLLPDARRESGRGTGLRKRI